MRIEQRLVEFANRTLDIMEREKDWSADVLDEIHENANSLGLSGYDDEGFMKRSQSS
jgi:hypothetical protein